MCDIWFGTTDNQKLFNSQGKKKQKKNAKYTNNNY
jgi:hypothetical protein